MKASSKLISLLKQWEGCRGKAYKDSGGELTVGVGHLLTRSERRSGKIRIGLDTVSWGQGLSDNQCSLLLYQDLAPIESFLNSKITKVDQLTQDQYDALVSFTFNVGVEAFRTSTLLKYLNTGEGDIPTQFRRWVYDNGKVVEGLVNRREHEIELWNGWI